MEKSKSDRLITGAFGVLLAVVAGATVAVAEPESRWGARALALALGVLGVDAIIASIRGTRSIISRIGPLP